MNRKVSYAKVHQEIFVPGLGSLGTTLPPKSKTVTLDMTMTEEGLLVKAGAVEILIPSANVALAVLVAEAAAAKK